MVATKKEITNKKDFKGDILDRKYSVYHDPQTGMYSYDFAEITPEVAAELQKMKYYRVSSEKLSEVEAELTKYLKKDTLALPSRAKGEIGKAIEERTEAYREIIPIYEELSSKRETNLTSEEKVALTKASSFVMSESRRKAYLNAKKRYTNYEEKQNEGKTLTNVEEEGQEIDSEIIEAYERLDYLYQKQKKGTLTPAEQQEISTLEEGLDDLETKIFSPSVTSNMANEKTQYNNARAKITQLEAIPEASRSVKQAKNYANLKAIVTAYETKYPKAPALPPRRPGNIEPGLPANAPSLEGAFPLPEKFEGFQNNVKGGKRRSRKSKKSKKSKRHTKRH